MVQEEVADETKDRGVEGEAVGRWAATCSDLERRAQLRDERTNNAANKIINKLVKHRRAHDKKENSEEYGVRNFLRKAEHLLIKQKKSFGYALSTLSTRGYFQ